MRTPPRRARSELAVPASSWRMIEKAVASQADLVFIDLEDAVAPQLKAESRGTVIRALCDLDWGEKPRSFRVNALDTPYFYRDLIEIVEQAGAHLDRVIVPKVSRPEDLHVVDTLLMQIELNVGLAPGKIGVEAQIETAAGLASADGIASAGERVECVTFGPGDFAASIRMPAATIGAMDRWDDLYPGHRLHYAMSRILVAGRAAGVQVLDGPIAEFRDLSAVRQSCLLSRALGYDGKWCIHPDQIPIVNEVFSPSAEEVEWARRVMDAYREATAAGTGAINLDGTLVDAASIRMAESTIALADPGDGATR